MKTRIIQTRFYDDEFIVDCDLFSQHLYMYLLTCQYINLCGIFQLSLKKVQFESKLSEEQLLLALETLSKGGKAFYHRGWFFIPNAIKNNNYANFEGNRKALVKEISLIPQDVISNFQTVDTTQAVLWEYYNSTQTLLPIVDPTVHKIRNKKYNRGSVRGMEVSTSLDESQDSALIARILNHFNVTFGRKFKTAEPWLANCNHWLQTYTGDEVCEAITEWRNGGWLWKLSNPDQISLELLFRKGNKLGPCDYIGNLLNRPKAEVSAKTDLTEAEFEEMFK